MGFSTCGMVLFRVRRGALGRILLMWDRRVVEMIEDCMRRFFVACSFKSFNDNCE